MPKIFLPLRADDLSGFTRGLAKQLGDASPSHLVLMNMLARSAGFQNVQHLRASFAAERRLATDGHDSQADHRLIERTLRQFDLTGRLAQWPSRRSVQTLGLWVIWAALPAGRLLREREVNDLLLSEHAFGDPATLRRTMIANTLLTRQEDGTNYRRVEREPPPEAKLLIGIMSGRRRRRNGPNVTGNSAEPVSAVQGK